MTPACWTILVGVDGPDFAVEGHGVRAFPELEHVEVVSLDELEADAHRRLDAGDAPMVAAADLDAIARVRRLAEAAA